MNCIPFGETPIWTKSGQSGWITGYNPIDQDRRFTGKVDNFGDSVPVVWNDDGICTANDAHSIDTSNPVCEETLNRIKELFPPK